MSDVLTPEQRRRNMAAIRGKNTRPELIVRRIAHRLGYRYRLHARKLPGCPDLVFPRLGKVILVHGCFWHMHACPYGRVTPRTRAGFWQAKRTGNVQRDRKTRSRLKSLGWNVLVIWECQTKDLTRLRECVRRFLAEPARRPKGSRVPAAGLAHRR